MRRALKNGKEQGLFWLKPETLERLRVEAFERRMKRSDIIEEALTLYFAEDKEGRHLNCIGTAALHDECQQEKRSADTHVPRQGRKKDHLSVWQGEAYQGLGVPAREPTEDEKRESGRIRVI